MLNLLQRKMFTKISFLVLIFVLSVTSQVIFDDDDQQFQPPRQTQRPSNFGSSFQQNRPQFQGQPQQFPQSPSPPQTTSGFQQERPFTQQPSFRSPDCQTFRDTDGFCTSINKCSFLSVILNSRPRGRANWILRRSICGFSGFLPMVCCPASRSQGNFDNENSIGNDNGFVSPSTFPQQPRPSANPPFEIINPNSNSPPVSSTPPPPPPPTPPPFPPTQSLSSTKSPFEINGPVTLVPPKPKPTSSSAILSTNPIPAISTPTLGFSGEGLPSDCGTSTGSQNRVVGGREASKGAWPWIAALGYRDGTGNIDYLCGGALVSKQFVVTASHCIRDDLTTVRLGDHDLFSDADGTKPINVDVVQKIKHPNYNPSTFQNDIAILKLNNTVDFTNQIRAICLPSTPQLKSSRFENTTPYVAGWGAIQFNYLGKKWALMIALDGATSQTLRQVQLPIVEDNVCQEKYKPFKTAHVDDTNICAGYSDGGKDACQGDSGGPLMMPVMNGNKYVLIGVVSFGFRCAEPGFPGVYSRVTSQLDWIESVINQK